MASSSLPSPSFLLLSELQHPCKPHSSHRASADPPPARGMCSESFHCLTQGGGGRRGEKGEGGGGEGERRRGKEGEKGKGEKKKGEEEEVGEEEVEEEEGGGGREKEAWQNLPSGEEKGGGLPGHRTEVPDALWLPCGSSPRLLQAHCG